MQASLAAAYSSAGRLIPKRNAYEDLGPLAAGMRVPDGVVNENKGIRRTGPNRCTSACAPPPPPLNSLIGFSIRG